MMGRAGSLTLIVSSMFLAVVALILNSPGLFYMGTALIALFAAAKIQAYLAVRGLIIKRILPQTAQIGEQVTVLLNIASTKGIQRPLVFVQDQLPRHMKALLLRPALPIAPTHGKFIVTSYIMRPQRRGVFTWNETEVNSTDALGLTSSKKMIISESSTLSIYPAPIRVPFPNLLSSGTDESGTGLRQASSGLQIRSVRDYVSSDPLKNIHWKSTAKTGKLMVKEFEIETSQACQIIMQHLPESENPRSASSCLDLLCGMALYVSKIIIEDQVSLQINDLDMKKTKANILANKKELDVQKYFVEVEPTNEGSVVKILSGDTMLKPSIRFIFMVTAEPNLLPLLSESGIQNIVYVLGECSANSHLRDSDCAYNPSYLQSLNRHGAQAIVVNAGGSI